MEASSSINSIRSVGTVDSIGSAAGTGADLAVNRRDEAVVVARRRVRYARKRLDLAPATWSADWPCARAGGRETT